MTSLCTCDKIGFLSVHFLISCALTGVISSVSIISIVSPGGGGLGGGSGRGNLLSPSALKWVYPSLYNIYRVLITTRVRAQKVIQ